MSVPASPPSASPPRRGHGCLWGCLAVIVIISLPAVIGAWFFWTGFRYDPALRAANELVRRDGIARLVLGDGIHITGVESRNFSFGLGLNSESRYTVDLEGSRGNGTLDVEAHVEQGRVKIDALHLIGPDGRRYDLLNHGLLPATPGNLDNSI